MALELMKFGVLSGEPFDAATERPFPVEVNYPVAPVDSNMKSFLLLSRVTSLWPMKLKNDMWNADVDFDLAGFHALVRLLKHTLRQLTQSCLASTVMKDLARIQMPPRGFMSASQGPRDPPPLLPPFMLPRACMGIVVKFFLQWTGDGAGFRKEVLRRYPCCAQPIEDLRQALGFWEELRRCVTRIAEALSATDLLQEMNDASTHVQLKRQNLNI